MTIIEELNGKLVFNIALFVAGCDSGCAIQESNLD